MRKKLDGRHGKGLRNERAAPAPRRTGPRPASERGNPAGSETAAGNHARGGDLYENYDRLHDRSHGHDTDKRGADTHRDGNGFDINGSELRDAYTPQYDSGVHGRADEPGNSGGSYRNSEEYGSEPRGGSMRHRSHTRNTESGFVSSSHGESRESALRHENSRENGLRHESHRDRRSTGPDHTSSSERSFSELRHEKRDNSAQPDRTNNGAADQAGDTVAPVARSLGEQGEFTRLRETGEPSAGARSGETKGGDAKTGGAKNEAAKKSRLKFTKEDAPPPDPQTNRAAAARRRADKAEVKLEKARDVLPKRRVVKMKKTYDEQAHKTKRRLVFEEEVKSKTRHLKGSPIARPIKAAANAAVSQAHRKIHEVEHENVGVEAGHKTELLAERGIRAARRHRKLAPYRKVERLERKTARLNMKAEYQKSLSENPKLRSTVFSRAAQKRRIRKQFAKRARDAQKAARRAKRTGSFLADAARAVGGFVRSHPVAFAVLLLLALIIIMLMSAVSSCASIATEGIGVVLSTSYTAPDSDIDGAELAYLEWETDLLLEVENAERTHPGYDEYRYSVDDVGHGPHELMAYLTAKYNDFSLSAIQGDLRAVFDEQYELEFIEEIEIRYRTETRYDPATGESYEVQVPYEWRILNVVLTARSFTDVIAPKLYAEQAERFGLLMKVKGNRQYAGSPFDFNWIPYISDVYGWRVHPISGGKDFHNGVDIVVAAGTEVKAAHNGTVTFAGTSGEYGLVVFVQGEKGVETRYAQCGQVFVSNGQSVKAGDVIATAGANGLHYEVLKNGQRRNPVFFAITNDDGSSDIPPGSPGGVEIPEYPGAPMDNARFTAMIAEAEKHLGKPYVFGASGPDKFDCSGFICYVLNNSGVASVGRTNAQGLYNLCTPVSRGDAQPGDLIFFTGTYNAGHPVTHVGLYIGNGQMVHAGKPVKYSSIDHRYWKEHYYAMARLP